jgi:hypothetical protein
MRHDSHPIAYIPFAECARTSAASPLGTEGATADVNVANKSNWHAGRGPHRALEQPKPPPGPDERPSKVDAEGARSGRAPYLIYVPLTGRYGRTNVSSLAVSFSVFGSAGDVALTVATLLMVPFLVGLTTMVTLAVAPLSMVPRLQVTIIFDRVHVPVSVETDPNPAVFGKLSTRLTPFAVSGPLLVTTTV